MHHKFGVIKNLQPCSRCQACCCCMRTNGMCRGGCQSRCRSRRSSISRRSWSGTIGCVHRGSRCLVLLLLWLVCHVELCHIWGDNCRNLLAASPRNRYMHRRAGRSPWRHLNADQFLSRRGFRCGRDSGMLLWLLLLLEGASIRTRMAGGGAVRESIRIGLDWFRRCRWGVESDPTGTIVSSACARFGATACIARPRRGRIDPIAFWALPVILGLR